MRNISVVPMDVCIDAPASCANPSAGAATERPGEKILARDFVCDMRDLPADAFLEEGSAGQAAADIGHRLARDHILGPDAKHHAVRPAERMFEHHPLELGIVALAPTGAGDEAPANLERAPLLFPVAILEAG